MMNKTCTYILLDDPGAYDCYGVSVSAEGETVSIPHLTHSRTSALRLLEQLETGGVTSVTAQDVAEDFLASLYE